MLRVVLREITEDWLKFAYFIVLPKVFHEFSLLSARIFAIEKTFAMEMMKYPMWLASFSWSRKKNEKYAKGGME